MLDSIQTYQQIYEITPMTLCTDYFQSTGHLPRKRTHKMGRRESDPMRVDRMRVTD